MNDIQFNIQSGQVLNLSNEAIIAEHGDDICVELLEEQLDNYFNFYWTYINAKRIELRLAEKALQDKIKPVTDKKVVSMENGKKVEDKAIYTINDRHEKVLIKR